MAQRLAVMVNQAVARMDDAERQRCGSIDVDVKCYRDCDTVGVATMPRRYYRLCPLCQEPRSFAAPVPRLCPCGVSLVPITKRTYLARRRPAETPPTTPPSAPTQDRVPRPRD